MEISVVQFAPTLFNREINHDFVFNSIKSINSDLIIFPELCLSGYFFLSREEASDHAIDFQSDIIKNYADLATELDRIIILGFAERSVNNIYNSAAMLFPDKKFNFVYRKTHLFYKEYLAFDKGNTGFFVIDYTPKDIKIGTMICYDWRFPEAARSLGLLGAELIACPSNLVTPLWPRVMPARAIENKVYLAVANRYGTEERNNETLLFNGKSAIYDYNGNPLKQAPASGDEVLTVQIKQELTRDKSFNSVNHIFNDRLTDMYVY